MLDQFNKLPERSRGAIARAIPLLGALALVAAQAHSQSFTVDDNPSAPAVGPVGPVGGCGAEDQFGLALGFCPTGLAPSPTLVSLTPPKGSGSILAPGPSVMLAGPNGLSIDALSANHEAPLGRYFALRFSVDRVSSGAPGSAVAWQAALNQQPGDVYESARRFANPAGFAGTLGTGPYAGTLAAVRGGERSNLLHADESTLGLVSGAAGVVPPTTAASAIGAGTHDNLDAFDEATLDADQDSLFDLHSYFSINPDEASLVGLSPSDLFDVAPGTASTSPTPFATAASMGLDSGGAATDSVDALVVFDVDAVGGPGSGGPGGQSGVDYALFSLAPGSASLGTFGLTAADILFTDFSGAFALYASSAELGLVGAAAPNVGDDVDALEITRASLPLPVPALHTFAKVLLAAALVFASRRAIS